LVYETENESLTLSGGAKKIINPVGVGTQGEFIPLSALDVSSRISSTLMAGTKISW